MQTASPDDLYLIGIIPTESIEQAKSLESWMHSRFKKHNIQGEWFSGSIKLKKAINEHELSKHNIDWNKVRDANSDGFWRLDSYGYDIKKIKRQANNPD